MTVLTRGDDPPEPPDGLRPGSSVTGPGPRSVAALRRDEVDQFLDPAEELRFEVGEAGHRAQDALPRPGGVRWPAEGPQHAFLPGLARGNLRPAADAERRRLDRRPDVDVRMPDDEHVRGLHGGSEPALLRPVHQVVHQDAEPAPGAGTEPVD